MNENEKILKSHVDKRLTISGAFDKLGPAPGKSYRVALVQDVTAMIEGKEIDLGHTWIQQADTFIGFNLEPSDRFTCSCRVLPYPKSGPGGKTVTGYGFGYPTKIEKIGRPVAFKIPNGKPAPKGFLHEEAFMGFDEPDAVKVEPPPAPPRQEVAPEPQADVVAVIREVRQLAKRVGGMEKLMELLQEL